MPLFLLGTIRNSVWTGSSVVLDVEPRAAQIPTAAGLGGKIVALYEPSGRFNHTPARQRPLCSSCQAHNLRVTNSSNHY
jgi:hypothetical protein